jgi:hypothetical protein
MEEPPKKVPPRLYVDRWNGDLIPTPTRQVIRNISLQEINHNQRLEFELDKARREVRHIYNVFYAPLPHLILHRIL